MPARPSIGAFQAEQREASIRKKTPGTPRRYEQACASLAGGVSSGLRRAARPYSLYFDHGRGSAVS